MTPKYEKLKSDGNVEVEARAGDVLMFSGPIQHCAMPNKSKLIR